MTHISRLLIAGSILATIANVNSAFAFYEYGLIVSVPDEYQDGNEFDVEVEQVVSAGDTDDLNINDEMELEGRLTDSSVGGSPVTDSDSAAYAVSYEVTATEALEEGQWYETRGSAMVEGEVLAHIAHGHGHAAAAAAGSGEIEVGEKEVLAEDDRAIAVAHNESILIGGTLTIAGFGGGATATVALAGEEESVEELADTDACSWQKVGSAVVNASWNAAHTMTIEKVGDSQENATARAKARVTVRCTVGLRIKSRNTGSGGGNGLTTND